LQVGVRGAEQLLGAGDADLLSPVDDLAAAVVAPTRVTLGVLVGQRGPERGQHGRRGEVFAGDELQPATEPVELVDDDRRDLGILSLQRVEVRPPEHVSHNRNSTAR
jgi:hypothetical protein